MGESYDDCVHGCMCGCGMHEGCVILAIATGPASANSTPFSLTCGLLGIGSKRKLKAIDVMFFSNFLVLMQLK